VVRDLAWARDGREAAVPERKEHGMVEVPPPPTEASWHKSTASSAGACVEVAHAEGHVWVRDSKDPGGPVLGFTQKEWDAFLVGVQRGEFD
jgi:hypothetical protein